MRVVRLALAQILLAILIVGITTASRHTSDLSYAYAQAPETDCGDLVENGNLESPQISIGTSVSRGATGWTGAYYLSSQVDTVSYDGSQVLIILFPANAASQND